MPALTRIFVYGSLLRDQPNHAFLHTANFIGTARTMPRYDMVTLGDFPAMLEGGATAIVGELYDVDQPTLNELDKLEEHPRFYMRAMIVLETGESVAAYILGRDMAEGLPRIASGDWRAAISRSLR
ncbi:MAG: gamma-glutamylcyclotransferase [Planctomycetaceae bacterium]|nr:gamma-glutamylcyclotransferase [Planctomycetaceae bacterium]